MKKIHSFLLGLIIILLLSCGEEKKKDTNFQKGYVPKELVYKTQTKDLLFDRFYPIGWSKSGKFAYIVEAADEATGFYFFSLIIKDIHKDRIVWKWKYDVSHEIPQDKGGLKKIFDKDRRIFIDKLNEYQIIPQKEFKVRKLAFNCYNLDYEFKMNYTSTPQKDFGFDVLTSAEIEINSPQLGRKLIQVFRDEDSMTLNAGITLCITSPYQTLAAILHFEELHGYEGPPNLIRIKITGTDLSTGFTK